MARSCCYRTLGGKARVYIKKGKGWGKMEIRGECYISVQVAKETNPHLTFTVKLEFKADNNLLSKQGFF